MPYCARKHQLEQSLVYHAYNRSNARVAVFHSDGDYHYFIRLLKEYAKRFGSKVYHWVVMPNHYHLLMELEKPENISKLMAGLNRTYTCYYHRNYATAGFLWQGRFKLQPVQKEEYLTACGRYIERNPVKANIVSEAKSYPYSSAQFYCLGGKDELTQKNPLFDGFGRNEIERQVAYTEFLRNFDSEQELSFDNLEQPVGSKEFVRRLILENGRYLPKRRGRPRSGIVL